MGNPQMDNHANQMNPNNDAFWQSRGSEERPENWEEVIASAEDDRKPVPDKPTSQQMK